VKPAGTEGAVLSNCASAQKIRIKSPLAMLAGSEIVCVVPPDIFTLVAVPDTTGYWAKMEDRISNRLNTVKTVNFKGI
jgi:hypothetical protein